MGIPERRFGNGSQGETKTERGEQSLEKKKLQLIGGEKRGMSMGVGKTSRLELQQESTGTRYVKQESSLSRKKTRGATSPLTIIGLTVVPNRVSKRTPRGLKERGGVDFSGGGRFRKKLGGREKERGVKEIRWAKKGRTRAMRRNTGAISEINKEKRIVKNTHENLGLRRLDGGGRGFPACLGETSAALKETYQLSRLKTGGFGRTGGWKRGRWIVVSH